MSTTVINIKNAPSQWSVNPDYVYIGRKRPGFIGEWGNPFVLRAGFNREAILRKYKEWFYSPENSYLRDSAYHSLHDKILVCYCKPLACHGDVIVDYIDNLHFGL